MSIKPKLESHHDYQKCGLVGGVPQRSENPCVEGGILVYDTFKGDESDPDRADELIAFIFFGGDTEDQLTVFVRDDECVTPGRTLRVTINESFDADTHGYEIRNSSFTIPVIGNDKRGDHKEGGADGLCSQETTRLMVAAP